MGQEALMLALRAAMKAVAYRHQAPADTKLRDALEELARRLDEWADAEKPESG